VNQGKSGLEAEGVRALGALGSLGLKMKLSAENKPEMHLSENNQKEK
jgi:hypothetical protein